MKNRPLTLAVLLAFAPCAPAFAGDVTFAGSAQGQSAAGSAQTITAYAAPASEPHHGVGLYVSNIAGSGLTYVQDIGAGFGFHVSGVAWGQSGSTFANFGGALTKEFDHREWGSLYGLVSAAAGVGSFFGGGGLDPASNVQVNFAPGVGVTWGPLMAEVGYSVYHNANGFGFVPAGGAGLVWKF